MRQKFVGSVFLVYNTIGCCARPTSGGASKLPSPPAGPPNVQSGQHSRGCASRSRKALQQPDQALGGCAAKPVQEPRRPDEVQRSPFETAFNANISPGRRGAVGDAAAIAKRSGSITESVPDLAISEGALRSTEMTPDKDRRCSSTKAPALGSVGPVTRCSAPKPYLMPRSTCDSRNAIRNVHMDRTGMPTAPSRGPGEPLQCIRQDCHSILLLSPATTAACFCRPRTSPSAAGAAGRQPSDSSRARQPSPRSPPEKPAMRRRVSLGAPQRCVSAETFRLCEAEVKPLAMLIMPSNAVHCSVCANTSQR